MRNRNSSIWMRINTEVGNEISISCSWKGICPVELCYCHWPSCRRVERPSSQDFSATWQRLSRSCLSHVKPIDIDHELFCLDEVSESLQDTAKKEATGWWDILPCSECIMNAAMKALHDDKFFIKRGSAIVVNGRIMESSNTLSSILWCGIADCHPNKFHNYTSQWIAAFVSEEVIFPLDQYDSTRHRTKMSTLSTSFVKPIVCNSDLRSCAIWYSCSVNIQYTLVDVWT